MDRRGPEIRDSCRELLAHPDYSARESGAFLLGRLGSRGQHGGAAVAVVSELGALTRRLVEEDAKELQAIGAAADELAEIGSTADVLPLRAVLLSKDEFLVEDTQWDAAAALVRLVGQPFMEADDSLIAARAWLASHTTATDRAVLRSLRATQAVPATTANGTRATTRSRPERSGRCGRTQANGMAAPMKHRPSDIHVSMRIRWSSQLTRIARYYSALSHRFQTTP